MEKKIKHESFFNEKSFCVQNIQLFYYWFKILVVQQLVNKINAFHLYFVWMQMELAEW